MGTYILIPVSVIVSMKSAASGASVCERGKSVQVVAARNEESANTLR
ncbi:hypothetical protein [Dactylosporangium sp. NPDC005555]